MLCMTGLALYAQETVFETATFQILIELPTNVVRQYPALGCPLHLEVGIVLFDKPIEKRLLWTVTFETNQSRALTGTRASQQLQHNRVLAMRRLAKLSDASQNALYSNQAYGRVFEQKITVIGATQYEHRSSAAIPSR